MKRLVVVSVGLAALMVGVVLAWYSVRQEREFQRLIAAGDAALAADQTYGAIEAFSGALVLKSDSMLAHLKRGDTYRRRGELTAALRDLREAASLDPSAPRPVELLGDVNTAMGRYPRAAEHYRTFIALDDRSPRVLYKLALAYYRNGQAQDAIGPLRSAVAMNDRFTEAHYLLGMCLRDRGQDDEAQRRADARRRDQSRLRRRARGARRPLRAGGTPAGRTRSARGAGRARARARRTARQRRARVRALGTHRCGDPDARARRRAQPGPAGGLYGDRQGVAGCRGVAERPRRAGQGDRGAGADCGQRRPRRAKR